MREATRELDATDRRLIVELQRDGRVSHQQLSELVGLSPTPCARRMRNLEAAGYITGYAAQIDEARMGFGFTAFVSVKLDHQVDDRLVSFERAMGTFPEVVDCWLMTGTRDYLLRVAVADLIDFERFLTGKLTKTPGVASLESSIPIRRVKGPSARVR